MRLSVVYSVKRLLIIRIVQVVMAQLFPAEVAFEVYQFKNVSKNLPLMVVWVVTSYEETFFLHKDVRFYIRSCFCYAAFCR